MRLLNKLTPILFSFVITLIVFWQLPVKGLVPFPGHLLAGRFFPWNSQSWQDYPTGVPYKEFISADTVRQTYPWRLLAIYQLKQGQIPWWNPYSFSGTPLLANIQSAPYYPLNILYWVLPFNLSWTVQVILQPILALTFTFIFARSLKLSRLASLFSGTAFAFSGYLMVWLELNTVAHAALWLPLALYALTNLHKQSTPLLKTMYFLLLSCSLTSSLLAGHIQTTLYLAITTLAYSVFLYISQSRPRSDSPLIFTGFALILATVISLPQLLPAYQLLRLSPRHQTDPQIFSQFLTPLSHLVTFIAPNFFGNPATANYWGQDYGEFMAYFGSVAFILFLVTLLDKPRTKTQYFFLILFFTCLILATANPLAHIPRLLKIPILSNSAPSRALFIVQFAGAILAGMGFDRSLKQPQSIIKALAATGLFLFMVWLIALFGRVTSSDPVLIARWTVSLRNLAIPTATITGFALLLFAHQSQTVGFKKTIPLTILLTALPGYIFFATKYLPFSEPKFFFPPSPSFNYLTSRQDLGRFFGDYTASVTSNTWLPSLIFSPEGYDALYLEAYGQLVTSSHTDNSGQLPETVPRSDANLEPNQDGFYRRRLQDLLAVRYLLDKQDFPQTDWDFDLANFPPDRYRLIWQHLGFKIYQNKQSSARTYLVSDYLLASSPQQAIDLIYDPVWNPSTTAILETEPELLPPPLTTLPDPGPVQQTLATATISVYSQNYVSIQATAPSPQLLVLTDVYYPGWRATVDGQSIPIYKTNYMLRSIVIPQGTHLIEFVYKPSITDLTIFSLPPLLK